MCRSRTALVTLREKNMNLDRQELKSATLEVLNIISRDNQNKKERTNFIL